jgi:hypothetical protein
MGTSESKDVVTDFDVETVVAPIGGTAASFTPIGPNRPLSLKIRSIYPGPNSHGSMLVASSVRNPSLFDAQPLALHYVFDHVRGGQLVRPRADRDGSNVIYYCPAVIDASLDISLRFAFDDFDAERYRRWVDVFAQAAGLPVFALGMSAGLGGAAAAQGVLYAAKKTVNLGIDLFDRHRDASNDWFSTWTLNISEDGLSPAKSGWLVFVADNPEPDVVGHDLLTSDGLYQINPDDGTLRRRLEPGKIAVLDEPYVVATLSGAKDTALASWMRGAVSAAVADRFLAAGTDAATGLGDLLEVYNDVVMARKISELDQELSDADADAVKELNERRKALVKNVLDDDLRKALKS